MSVVLARIDQRLIHGLVVNQWAPALQVKRFMVVDDVLCNNEDVKASMRMTKPAGTGVAMANAPDEVKAHADYVTASNDDDGVARVLERLVD